MISVDGMRPADVIHSQALGIKLPFLNSMMRQGAFASDVVNVAPTITLPNHATLMTGVKPAEHGVVSNLHFDPLRDQPERYYWFASDIHSPTLWDLAHRCGGRVASVNWPGSVGSAAIDANVPEYFRDHDADDVSMVRALSTPGLVDHLEARTGVALSVIVKESIDGDADIRAYAAAIYDMERPTFMTVHFTSLDLAQHLWGPGSPQAHKALEAIDQDIEGLVAAGRAVWPNLRLVVVSDHGFAPVHHDLNLYRVFAEAGLVTYDVTGTRVTAWEAAPTGGAFVAVRLTRPDDPVLLARVSTLLQRLAADPAYHMRRVLDRSGGAEIGGDPAASFFIDFQPGYEMSQRIDSPMIGPSPLKGMHGWLPDDVEMHSSLFVSGPDVPAGRNLGRVDMLDIAPTVATWIGCPMPSAKGRSLF